MKDVQYYKGLGTFTKEQAIKIGKKFDHYTKCIRWSNRQIEEKYITILFEADAKMRKQVINRWQPIVGQDRSNPSIDIKYLMSQVTEYFVASLDRAIPDHIDGLKDVQRKIAYYFMHHNQTKKTQVKVSTAQGYIASSFDYHHGDTSLQQAIIAMAQDFAGSNNCNLLVPSGSFGIRFDHTAAAPRYIYTYASEWLRLLFDENESLIYEYNLSDEGDPIEPKRLFPLVPLALVNGCNGIAAGWKSDI